MRERARKVVYDPQLHIEAYRLTGLAQPFPDHFHEYYVIGLVETGRRALRCKNREYATQPGDILLFNPGESHGCVQSDGRALDYRGLNISQEVMPDLVEKATGERDLPCFSRHVVRDVAAAAALRTFHQLVMHDSEKGGKEESLLRLLSHLIERYARPIERCGPECGEEIEKACAFLEERYAQPIHLDEVARFVGLSKSTLLRAFVRSKGVTPYRYLENIRVGQAKKLLEQGVPPAQVALRTGFSDQSHFTNYFSRFIGLSPGAYREIFTREEG